MFKKAKKPKTSFLKNLFVYIESEIVGRRNLETLVIHAKRFPVCDIKFRKFPTKRIRNEIFKVQLKRSEQLHDVLMKTMTESPAEKHKRYI